MEENELRRRARKTGFDLAALEKDYALTWLLNGIYWEDSKLRDILIFKGGTAIRKVYFPEWRLSEDLDFTIIQEVDPQDLKQSFEQVFLSVNRRSNIAYSFSSFTAGEYAILADVQFLGQLTKDCTSYSNPGSNRIPRSYTSTYQPLYSYPILFVLSPYQHLFYRFISAAKQRAYKKNCYL